MKDKKTSPDCDAVCDDSFIVFAGEASDYSSCTIQRSWVDWISLLDERIRSSCGLAERWLAEVFVLGFWCFRESVRSVRGQPHLVDAICTRLRKVQAAEIKSFGQMPMIATLRDFMHENRLWFAVHIAETHFTVVQHLHRGHSDYPLESVRNRHRLWNTFRDNDRLYCPTQRFLRPIDLRVLCDLCFHDICLSTRCFYTFVNVRNQST